MRAPTPFLATLFAILPIVALAQTSAEPMKPAPTDIFLLIGQSNMAGRGAVEAVDKEVVPGIWVQNKNLAWVVAVDPLHYDKPAPTPGAGLGRTFAITLQKLRPGAQIGLVPAALGGSSLDQWTPGGTLYKDAVARAQAALAQGGKLRAILWHQGESDSGKKELADTYTERWIKLMTSLRADLKAPNVPIIVGQLGPFVEARTADPAYAFAQQVDIELAALAARFPNVVFVPSIGLKDKGDQLHFDSPSLREFGRRYAYAFLMLEPAWATSPAPAALAPAR